MNKYSSHAFIAKRYSQVLWDTFLLNSDDTFKKSFQDAWNNLKGFLESSPALIHVIARPCFSGQKQIFLLNELCQIIEAPQLLKNFLSIILINKRWALLSDIVRAFDQLNLEAIGKVLGSVQTAAPLNNFDQEQIKNWVAENISPNISLEYQVNPKLLGGVIVRCGGMTWDGSVLMQLRRLRHQFNP